MRQPDVEWKVLGPTPRFCLHLTCSVSVIPVSSFHNHLERQIENFTNLVKTTMTNSMVSKKKKALEKYINGHEQY